MVIDDRKELLTRAEIMNRVYLQDISKLDVDINRLEKLLDRDIHHTSIATLDNVNVFPCWVDSIANFLLPSEILLLFFYVLVFKFFCFGLVPIDSSCHEEVREKMAFFFSSSIQQQLKNFNTAINRLFKIHKLEMFQRLTLKQIDPNNKNFRQISQNFGFNCLIEILLLPDCWKFINWKCFKGWRWTNLTQTQKFLI